MAQQQNKNTTVLEQLPYDPLLRGRIAVETVAWDKPGAGTPMLATLTPQESIRPGLPKPSECAIVIVIFWSRMGTPLPEDWLKPDGGRYLSGTEWEYWDALQAAGRHGSPDILVYRRTEEPPLRLSDPEREQKIEQWDLVETFFQPFRNADGSLGWPLEPEPMCAELDDPATSHERRALIGVRLALLSDTRKGVGRRADGLPDIVWCEVPGGEITLKVEEKQSSSAAPPTFQVKPFYIAKYPVTYSQYRAFLEDPKGYRNPAWWRGLWFQVNEPGRQFQQYDNQPAENVCWLEAVAFCRWLSDWLGYEVRLPTEWEWQQAATGGNPANVYPWRPDWDGGAGPILTKAAYSEARR